MITVTVPSEVDHLIIGAGTSGCVVAGRLAATGGRSVLVLEAGGGDGGLRSRVPAGTKWMFGRTSHDWQHASEPDPSLAVHTDLPGVGQGLMDHPVAMLSARVDLPTYNVQAGLAGASHHAWRYAVHRDGPLATPHAQLVAHVRSTPEALRPDVQIAFYPYAFERTANGVEPARTPAVMFSVTACQGRGQGEVTLASADALAAPRVRHRLLADPADVRTLISGCRLVHRIAAQAPLARHICEWIDIGRGHGDDTGPDDARWQRYLRDAAVLAYHPAGTCRMAELQRDPLGVVDARLRVHGIDGLRVADNSIMPTPVSSNTQAAAYVIGEKAAEMLLQDT